MVGGQRRPEFVVLAHVEKLMCSFVHLFLTDASDLGEFALDASRVNVPQKTFRV
jgi:hypothetical protein